MADYGDVVYVLVLVGLVLMALGALGLVPAWMGSWVVGLAGPVALLVSFPRRGLRPPWLGHYWRPFSWGWRWGLRLSACLRFLRRVFICTYGGAR